MAIKFIVDINAGRLVRWLRLMGYDALLFRGKDDGEMVKTALQEERVILTRDTHILKRRAATTGRLNVLLIEEDTPEAQLQQVAGAFDLDYTYQPFSRCLECNELLVERSKEDVRNRVPPHVFKTQAQYMECPSCHRIYWQGTHWQRMTEDLNRLREQGKGRE
jgi:uncharacterized protein with PIN domain